MDYIGVLPDKFRRGISKLRGPHTYVDKGTGRSTVFEPESQWRTPLLEALTTHYETDAHCTCYWAEGQENLPLLRKEVLPELLAADVPVIQTAIMLDWDTPPDEEGGKGHVPLTQEHINHVQDRLKAVEGTELGNWYAFYTTRHGARIVYRPVKGATVLDGERYTRSIINMFKEEGLELDESCCDWTRRFRLPYVVRDGQPSTPDIQVQGKEIDLKNIKKAHKKALWSRKAFERKASHPTQEECRNQLRTVNDATGSDVQSAYYKKAKKALKSSDWFDVLFNEADFQYETGRNDVLQMILGEIIPLLVRRAGASASGVFALMYGPLCQWEPAAGKIHPHEHAWNFIQDIVEREVSRYNEEQEKEADKQDTAADLLGTMARGMMSWDVAEDLESADEDVREAYVSRHLFCRLKSVYLPMLADGTYSKATLRDGDIIPYIQTSYMKNIIDVYKWSREGERVFRTAVDIINSHACIAQKGDYRPQMPSGGVLEDKYAQEPILVLPMYRRNAFLRPEFDPYVDGWLRRLFEENFDAGCKWLAYSLDFEAGPISALSLQGAGSTGKKVLVEGLAECLEIPAVVLADAVSGTSQGMLLTSPFLHVNESWPSQTSKKPPDYFKSMTAGDRITVSEKYMPNTTCLNPIRMIMTANGPDLIYALTEARSVSPNDRQAIGDRLLHFDITDAAKKYLESLGGPGHTAKDGQRWIRGDAGQASNYVVAKHFLWLYENRKEKWPRKAQDRYCVMGNCGTDSHISHRMMTRSNSVSTIIKAIIGVTENMDSAFKQYTRYKPDTCQLFLSESGISKYAHEILAARIDDKEVTDGMQNLIVSDTPVTEDHKNYYEIDCASVLNFATGRGLDAPVLRGIEAKQQELSKR